MISSFNRKLSDLSRNRKKLFFVQIGANDGYTADPIYNLVKKYGWSGVLVEPVPEYFQKLKQSYKGVPNLSFANVAIADKNGYKTLYGFSDQAPFWIKLHTKTKNSFSKKTILSHSWYMPNLEKFIVGQKVKAINVETLIKEYTEGNVDMIFIDTEGYDFEILKQFDLKNLRPSVVYYEHKHLSLADKNKSWAMITEQGYKLEHDRLNTFAYLD